MSVPSSLEELLQLIRKSGMVDEPRLNDYVQRHPGFSQDPREAADLMVRDGILTEFQKEQFLLGKWRGFTIGKYKLLERVGVGGMGQVFLCEHMFMKRRVAIKVLPPAKAEQPAALGRFYREARAAGSLEHPNIVRTHDIDQDGNLHFIVMEYVDGSNLLEMVKKFGPMDVGRAVYYTRQVAIGLDYAFRSGIIHRDIKPGNVLIDRRGAAKVLDMGLARFYNDTSDMLTVKYDDKIVLGTADYVAPEQVANSHAVDVRADIYALGASLYFLLAGHPPFPQGTVSQKLLWHRTKDPTPLRQVRPEVPEVISALVQKMMAKDPNRRFQTPAEVAAALEPWCPAHVPPPAAEEMPQLSPAALEAAPPPELAELSLSAAAVSAPPPVAAAYHAPHAPAHTPAGVSTPHPFGATSPAPAGPSPFGPAAGSNPFGMTPAAMRTPAAGSRAGFGGPPRPAPGGATPFRGLPGASKFPKSQQVDVATSGGGHKMTPADGQLPTRPPTPRPPSRIPVPAPVMAPPAAPARLALVGVMVLAATIAGAGLFLKFGRAHTPPSNTPPTAAVAKP